VLLLEPQKQVQQSVLYDNWVQAGRLDFDFQQGQRVIFKTYAPSPLPPPPLFLGEIGGRVGGWILISPRGKDVFLKTPPPSPRPPPPFSEGKWGGV